MGIADKGQSMAWARERGRERRALGWGALSQTDGDMREEEGAAEDGHHHRRNGGDTLPGQLFEPLSKALPVAGIGVERVFGTCRRDRNCSRRRRTQAGWVQYRRPVALEDHYCTHDEFPTEPTSLTL